MGTINTQKARLRECLKSGKSITPRQALFSFGCMALSQRIGDLRREGMDIISERVEGGYHHHRYYLRGGTTDALLNG